VTAGPDDRDRRSERAIRANYELQREAMVVGDTDALDNLLAGGFTLTHMTGHVQAKEEWLAAIRSGEMTYHAMEDVEVSVAVDGAAAELTARTRTEATIWGGHGTWQLRLRMTYAYDGESWLPTSAVASTW
jgi:hypothetical protein